MNKLLYTAECISDVDEGYLNYRLKNKKIEDNIYKVILGVVNRPSKKHIDKTNYITTKELIENQLTKFIGIDIGEDDSKKPGLESRNELRWNDTVKRFRTIDTSKSSGILIDYELDTFRDMTKSILIMGTVKVNDFVAEKLETGKYAYVLRSLALKDEDKGWVLKDILAFDLCLVSE